MMNLVRLPLTFQGLAQWRLSVLITPGAALDLKTDDEGKSILLDVVSPVTKAEQRTES